MNGQTTRDRILSVLQGIAPEVEPLALAPARPLREQVDLDSMDWLNLVDRVGERLGVTLGDAALAPSASLDDWVAAAQAARPLRAPRGGARLPATALRRLADGRRVRLHAVVAADAPLLANLVRGLSTTSRYRRFMVSLRELPPDKLKSLTAVDQRRHIALAATAVGSRQRAWIGVARSIADATGDSCEFALTVADAWQGTGLAGLLMRELMAAARARGHGTMHGEVLASNRPMLSLAKQLGFAVQRREARGDTLWVERAL